MVSLSTTFLFDLDFEGTIVNLALPSLHGGSLEITLTVSLRDQKEHILKKL